MSLGNITLGCGGNPCAYQIRAIGGSQPGGGDPTSMLAWVNNDSNFTLAACPWGKILTGTFNADGSFASSRIANVFDGNADPVNLTEAITGVDPCSAGPNPTPTVQRSQYYLPFPTSYAVLAAGYSISVPGASCGGAYYASHGCTRAPLLADAWPLIVNLPIPDYGTDGTILVTNYFMGIINPSLTATVTNWQGMFSWAGPSLASVPLTSGFLGLVGNGSEWDTTLSC